MSIERRERLGNICDILNGFAFKSEEYASNGVRVIRIANVQKGYLEDNSPVYYPRNTHTVDLRKYALYEGDILLSLTGNVGRVARITADFLPAVLNQRVACLRIKANNVLSDYLYCVLNSDLFENKCIHASNGVAQKNLSTEWLKEYEIPLLSLDEQKQVASKFNIINRVIQLRKKQLQALDDLIKARFVEMFRDPCLPKQELFILIIDGAGLSYGIVQPGDDGTGDMGVIRPVDIVNGKIMDSSIKYIDRTIGDGFRKTELTGDELLITVRGTTGITALTDQRFKGMNVTRGIAVIRYDRNKINPIYLNTYLKTEESQRYIQEHTRGATLQQINLSELRVQKIVVPDRDKQDAFASFAQKIENAKAITQESLDKTQMLFDSLMQKYFQ